MNLINIKVQHKIFGQGIIVASENSYITVRFQNDEKKFVYPSAFDGYLVAENSIIAENIRQEIETIKRIQQEEKERLEELEQQKQIQRVTKGKYKKAKVYPRENIAFKCNFCDGGHSNEQVGFSGVCSDGILRNNIELEKRLWCSSDDCPCAKYLKGEITRLEVENVCDHGGFVCYESQMLRDWRAFAGIVRSGNRKGQPMKLDKIQNNSLCVLTTRDPNSIESERYIFAVFIVDETNEGDNGDEGYISGSTKYRIKLSPEEAHKMLFWNYHANDNRADVAAWNSGLHRYFGDDQAVQILQDILKLKQNSKEEKLVDEFFQYFIKINNIDVSNVPEKNGALLLKNKL